MKSITPAGKYRDSLFKGLLHLCLGSLDLADILLGRKNLALEQRAQLSFGPGQLLGIGIEFALGYKDQKVTPAKQQQRHQGNSRDE